ncbi:MAG: ribosome biogenesis GTPase Der [Bacteroides sp.]|jgi:GTP-binding protein|nr:ribosome biogenesis GTPase Der [Bacteroides sp.]
MANIVALVGRPNVGKSTLFNRLTQTRIAIVDATSGVTRDRHYGKSDWNGMEFSVIDTGGYVVGSDDVFEEQIRRQVAIAVEEASVILFLVDTHEGLTPMDEEVADILRRSNKKVLLVANKVDSSKHQAEAAVFYQLGMGEVFNISSISGSGTGELLDAVVTALEKVPEEEPEEDLPRFAVIGRPNVGKSSLINALIGEERNIVTDIPGTTRDSIFTRYKSFGFDFYLVDTAGLRKKGKVTENIEFYSVMRSVRAIESADVCLLLVDATEGFQSQDQNIFGLAARNNKGVVILVNKWDLVEKDHKTSKEFEANIHEAIAPFQDVPIIFTSVITKQRILKAMEMAVEVYRNRTRKITTSKLNEVLLPIIENTPPPSLKGKYIRIKYITQLHTHYPSFALFCNLPQYVRESYYRFIENKIREHWDFTGVPIKIYFRKK